MKTVLAAICALALAAPFAACQTAQTQTPPRPISDNFDRMFPSPSGQNAYEDFVHAGDSLANSDAWQALEKTNANGTVTLAAKRAALADRGVRDALDAIRTGIQKPAVSPYGKMDDETRLPELRTFRSIGRLLGVEEYVQLADGKVESAIDTLFEALRFGYAIQQGALIHGLIAIASDTIALRQIEAHLDQLSERECGRLVQLASDWAQKPDPALAIVAGEGQMERKALKKYRKDPNALASGMYAGDTSDQAESDRAFLSSLADNPTEASLAFTQAESQINAMFGYELNNLSLPYWQRKPWTPVPDAAGPGARLANMISVSSLDTISDRYTRELAEVQLLGVYAAVVRYRWENDHLPEGIGELRLAGLGIDPFSGQLFAYRKIDAIHFELASIGPPDRSTDPPAPPGQRIQLVMPARPAH